MGGLRRVPSRPLEGCRSRPDRGEAAPPPAGGGRVVPAKERKGSLYPIVRFFRRGCKVRGDISRRQPSVGRVARPTLRRRTGPGGSGDPPYGRSPHGPTKNPRGRPPVG